MRYFIAFLRVLFGTPLRAIVTVGVAAWASVIEQLFPGVLGDTVYRMVHAIVAPVLGAVLRVLVEALGPFIVPILSLCLAIYGIRVMLFGKGKGNKRRR